MMKDFFLGVIEITLGTSLLIGLLFLVLRLVGAKFTAKCRYILWTLVLLRLAIPFSFGIIPALIEVPVEPVEQEPMQSQPIEPDEITVFEITPPTPQNNVTVPREPVQSTTVVTTPEIQAAPEPEAEPVAWEDVLQIIAVVYTVGVAAFLLWHLTTYALYTHSILKTARVPDDRTAMIYSSVCHKNGIKNPPVLLIAPNVNSPAAFGIFRRRIVLPDIEFNENGLAGTLSHEITHCRRGDLYIKLLALLARSLHWFNPLSHLAALRCEMEMELSCDEAVLAGCDDDTRVAYGEVMLDIIRRCRRNRGALTTHFNPKKSAVNARFMNILYGSGKRRGTALIAVCLVLCILAGTVVACRVDSKNTTDGSNTLWTYALSDEHVLTFGPDAEDDTEYYLTSADSAGEEYVVTQFTTDNLTWGSQDNEAMRTILPLDHTETDSGYLFYISYNVSGTYFYEITLTEADGRLACDSIEEITQERAEELGVFTGEQVTVTSLEELAEYRDRYIISESFYDFYYNLLSGKSEIPEYNSVVIEDYTIRFTVPVTEYSTYFDFTVTESGLDTLPVGEYSWQLLDLREVTIAGKESPNSDESFNEVTEVKKLRAFLYGQFIYNTPTYSQGTKYPGIHNYICNYYGENGAVSYEEYYRVAEEEFGVTDFTPLELEAFTMDDGLIYAGGIGGGWFGDVEDVIEDESTVTVVMQFYADCNYLLKSYKIEYYFGRDGKWLGYEIVEDSPYEPYGLSYAADDGNDESTPDANTAESKARWSAEYSDGVISLMIDENYSGHLLCTPNDGDMYEIVLPDSADPQIRKYWFYSYLIDSEFENGELNLWVNFAKSYYYHLTFKLRDGKFEFNDSTIRDFEDLYAETWLSEGEFTVTNFNELKPYADAGIINCYEFFFNLLSGASGIPEYNTVMIEDYSISFKIPLTDNRLAFDFTVTESGLDTLPTGEYHMIVDDKYDTFMSATGDIDHMINPYTDVKEAMMLETFLKETFIWNAPEYGKSTAYAQMAEFLCEYYGDSDARLALDEFKRLAAEKFGWTDVDESKLYFNEDGMVVAGEGGGALSYTFENVTTENGITTVTVQFYADCNALLKSHKVAYYFGENETWLGYDVIEAGRYEPYGLSYVADDGNGESTPVSNTAESKARWSAEYSDGVISLMIDENYSGHLLCTPNDGDSYEITPLPKLDKMDTWSGTRLIDSANTTDELTLWLNHTGYGYGYFRVIFKITDGKLAADSVEVIDERTLRAETWLPEGEITVTNYEDLLPYSEIGFINAYQFFYDLLSGESEISEYNSVIIENYTIRFTAPLTDHKIYFDYTITESGLDTMPVGEYHKVVRDIVDKYLEDVEPMKSKDPFADVKEVKMLKTFFTNRFIWNTPTFGKGVSSGMHNFLCVYYGTNSALPLEEYKRLAAEKFGVTITDDMIPYVRNDGYVEAGGIGGSINYTVEAVTTENGITTVTVQFYADCNALLKSHKVAYYFGENETWLGYDVIEAGRYEPYGLSYAEDVNEPAHSVETDLSALYQTFIDTVLVPYEEYMTGMEYLDLDMNGTPELIIYDWGASANWGINIFTIENGEVRSFQRGTNTITHYSSEAKTLAEPSVNAVDYGFWGVSTTFDSDKWLCFKPCTADINGHLLYSYNASEIWQSAEYYLFCSDKEGYLSAKPLIIFSKEAVNSDPAQGWSYFVNGEQVSSQEYIEEMRGCWEKIEELYGVKYSAENTFGEEVAADETAPETELITFPYTDKLFPRPTHWESDKLGTVWVTASTTPLFAYSLYEWSAHENDSNTGLVWRLAAYTPYDFRNTFGEVSYSEIVGTSGYVIGTDSEFVYLLNLPTDVQYIENDSASREQYEQLQRESQAVFESFMEVNGITPNTLCPASEVYAPAADISETDTVVQEIEPEELVTEDSPPFTRDEWIQSYLYTDFGFRNPVDVIALSDEDLVSYMSDAYLAARTIYSFHYIDSDGMYGRRYWSSEMPTVTIGNRPYSQMFNPVFPTLADWETYMRGILSDNLTDSLLATGMFIDYEGELWGAMGARGTDISKKTVGYSITSRTDKEIIYTAEVEIREMDLAAEEPDYIEYYDFTYSLTEDGWRWTDFYLYN